MSSKNSSTVPAPSSASRGSAALQRLRRGEINLDGYLDDRAEFAVKHLQNLTSEQLSIVRDTIRNELTCDPELIELVREITGLQPESAPLGR